MMMSHYIKLHVQIGVKVSSLVDEDNSPVEEARNCGWQILEPKGTCSSHPSKHGALSDTAIRK